MNRRFLLRTSALALPALALAACASTTVNGVTKITLNLVTLQAYATAVKNGVSTLLSVPALSAALGSVKVAAINALVADMAGQVAALNAANKGVATLTFTVASVPAAVSAFEADASSLMNDVVVVATSLAGSLAANVVATVDALQTVLAIGEAVASTSVGAAKPKMGINQALTILKAA